MQSLRGRWSSRAALRLLRQAVRCVLSSSADLRSTQSCWLLCSLSHQRLNCRLYERTPAETNEHRHAASPSPQPQPSTSGRGLPVYVMLPLDTVWLVERDGKQVRHPWQSLAALPGMLVRQHTGHWVTQRRSPARQGGACWCT